VNARRSPRCVPLSRVRLAFFAPHSWLSLTSGLLVQWRHFANNADRFIVRGWTEALAARGGRIPQPHRTPGRWPRLSPLKKIGSGKRASFTFAITGWREGCSAMRSLATCR
jgi:hypothetical protein